MFFKPVVTERSSSSSPPDRHRRSAGAPSAHLKHNGAHQKSSVLPVYVQSDETPVRNWCCVFLQSTYQLKLHPPRQGRPLHRFDAVSGQPALSRTTPKKKKKLNCKHHLLSDNIESSKSSYLVSYIPTLAVDWQQQDVLGEKNHQSFLDTLWGRSRHKFSLFCCDKSATGRRCLFSSHMIPYVLLKCFCVSFFQILMLLSSYE